MRLSRDKVNVLARAVSDVLKQMDEVEFIEEPRCCKSLLSAMDSGVCAGTERCAASVTICSSVGQAAGSSAESTSANGPVSEAGNLVNVAGVDGNVAPDSAACSR